jgi:demethylmenaquinone methyltransferase/2-methoxy-6-polyprenyl-1,4-benzoquinol methylase
VLVVTSRPDAAREALEAQKRYYDLRAPDYLTIAPSDRRIPGILEPATARALVDELRPEGDVLELACGPGGFTAELARSARSVTAVDSSTRMLARNRSEVAQAHVEYVHADLFDWRPQRAYDVVFFGFWLSHVPPSRFDEFWRLVRLCVGNRGRVAFVDEDDRGRDNDERSVVDGVPLARRTLRDGRWFDIVKLYWNPKELTDRLDRLGWDVTIRRITGTFMFGTGSFATG